MNANKTAAILAIAAVLSAAPARAEKNEEVELPAPGWRYLWEPGVLALGVAPLGVVVGTRLLIAPPATPRLFSPDEGGAEFRGDTVPEAAVALLAAVAGGLVFISPGDANWHHGKGFGQAAVTTLALTELAKNIFGRHRPHYTDNTIKDDRRSFFSGHSSVTWMSVTYLSLYLNEHYFAKLRPAGTRFAWWEAFPYLVLAGGAAYVSWSRIDDNRHHPSDVITGGVVGAATSILFYRWQERRYRRAKKRLERLRALRP